MNENYRLVNEVEAAKVLGVAVQTLRKWRCQMKPPAYHKISRSVRYRLDDLEAFIAARKIEPEINLEG